MATDKRVISGYHVELGSVEIDGQPMKQPPREGEWAWLEPMSNIGAVHEDIYGGGVNMVCNSRKFELHVRLLLTDPWLRDGYKKAKQKCLDEAGIEVLASDANNDRPVSYQASRAVFQKAIGIKFPGELSPSIVELVFEGLFDASDAVSAMSE